MAKSARKKFKKYPCAVCGQRFGLKPALNRIRRDFRLSDELIDLCPDCRRKRVARDMAASIRELS